MVLATTPQAIDLRRRSRSGNALPKETGDHTTSLGSSLWLLFSRWALVGAGGTTISPALRAALDNCRRDARRAVSLGRMAASQGRSGEEPAIAIFSWHKPAAVAHALYRRAKGEVKGHQIMLTAVGWVCMESRYTANTDWTGASCLCLPIPPTTRPCDTFHDLIRLSHSWSSLRPSR